MKEILLVFWGGERPLFSVKVSVQRFFGDVPLHLFLGKKFSWHLFWLQLCFSEVILVEVFFAGIFLSNMFFKDSFGRRFSSHFSGEMFSKFFWPKLFFRVFLGEMSFDLFGLFSNYFVDVVFLESSVGMFF